MNQMKGEVGDFQAAPTKASAAGVEVENVAGSETWGGQA